ncbi:MAG: hypothetical protein HKL90_04630 [Elusimicrobia bacterium]|nr:hypothetical protein [Elusimicrobiota bacterium]
MRIFLLTTGILCGATAGVGAQFDARLAPADCAPVFSAVSAAAAPLGVSPVAVASPAAALSAPASAASSRSAAPLAAMPTAAPARALDAAARLSAVPARALAAAGAAAMDGSRLAAKAGDAPAAQPVSGKMDLLKLRPTQMAVGLREVDKKIARLSSKKGKKYLRSMPVPVVLGPHGHVYMTDHHHLVRAAWEAGYTRVRTSVQADYSHLSDAEFWKRMKAKNWVYPYDQLGAGPHNPIDLPENVRGMADDPYRSVAGEVRERGGYRKNDAPFSEFLWAQFFRAHLTVHPVYHGFEAALAQAMALAKTTAANGLPGWIGAK